MEQHRTVMELGPVIGYVVAIVAFVAALVAWDTRHWRKRDEEDARILKNRYGFPRRQG